MNVEDNVSKSYLEEKELPGSSTLHILLTWGSVGTHDTNNRTNIRCATAEFLRNLSTEVSAIINSRPLTAISTDSDDPIILSPALLLTHKNDTQTPNQMDYNSELDMRDIYRAQWKRVQCLSELFWQKWKKDYLHSLQSCRNWPIVVPNLTEGSIVLLKNDDVPRHMSHLARNVKVLPSDDGKIRKVVVRIHGYGKHIEYFRLILELAVLIEYKKKCVDMCINISTFRICLILKGNIV